MLDLPYDFDSLIAAGSMSGSGAIIVMDDSTDIVEALANISRILRARKLRPMHALPRRFALDGQGAASPDPWPGPQAGCGLPCSRSPTTFPAAARFALLAKRAPGRCKVSSASSKTSLWPRAQRMKRTRAAAGTGAEPNRS